MEPTIIQGRSHIDERGIIAYNNSFVPNSVKKIYFIENHSTDFQRGWQGHKIEQRWFVAAKGIFTISLIKLENWENPNINSTALQFRLESTKMDVLHVPSGYISRIQALEEDSKLMAMSDYTTGEIEDEFRFPLELFK